MGFGLGVASPRGSKARQLPAELLYEHGCKLCPLNHAKITSPKMPSSGSANPLVYILGEAPGKTEDQRGRPFVGNAGRLLWSYIPRNLVPEIRISNVQQCWPGPGNPDPTEVSLACCRPRVDKDINTTRPVVIFGLGNYALQWAIGRQGIMMWRGRRLPIKVLNHQCWFYPMLHPASILHQDDEWRRRADEDVFKFDIRRALDEIDDLPEPVVHTREQAKANITCVTGSEAGALGVVENFLRRAMAAPRAGVDYETTGRRPYAEQAKILSAAVSLGGESLSFAFDHPEAGWSVSDRRLLVRLWLDFLMSPVRKVSHFMGFELEWSAVFFGRETVHVSCWEDTASQAWVRDQRTNKHKDGPLSLGWLTLQHFGLNIKTLSNLNRDRLGAEPLPNVLTYNAIDARYHDALFVAQHQLLKQEGLIEQYELMCSRIPSVVLTQVKGLPVDTSETERLAASLDAELVEVDQEINEMPAVKAFEQRTGTRFNPNTPKSVVDLLRSDLKIFVDNSDEEVLSGVNHPIAPALIRHRKITKRKSTYVEPYTSRGALWPDGLLHPNFNTVFTRTGRSSADEPNVQNAIKHDKEGKVVRKQVRARPGHVFVSVDQGQIQARNVAMESRDKTFCKMLWEDYDIHMEWAERFSRQYPESVGGKKNFADKDIMRDFRQKTKNRFVFAMFFNAQIPTIVSGMGIPEHHVKPVYNEFWRVFHGIKDWHEKLYKQYREYGYVTHVGGFIFRAPLSPNQIVNYPIQMDESLILFSGFNRLSKLNEPLLQPNNEIHDDLLFEIPVEEVDRCVETIVIEMLKCDFDWINVPLSVDVSIGENWLDMHEELKKVRSDKWLGQPARALEFV